MIRSKVLEAFGTMLDMSLLKTKNLTKLYAPDTGAQDINIELKEGEIVGFIGPNGAGKSTTMEMIMQLIGHESGTIEILDQEVRSRKDLVPLLNNIGYLPAEGGVYDFLSSRDFLIHCANYYEDSDTEKIFALAEEIKLDLDKKISNLSSGNRKKVSFLSCIIHSPKILILDEPTSSLDPLVQKQLLVEVEKVKEAGGSVLLSSHVLSEVQSVCDRVYLIKDSKIILSEKTETLVSETQKRISIKNPSKKLRGVIKKIPDLKNLTEIGNGIEFFTNDIKRITTILVENDHYDYLIEQPSLEKMFMKYYE